MNIASGESADNGLASGSLESLASSKTETQAQTQTDEQVDKRSKEPWHKVLGVFLIFFNIWGIPISFGAFQAFFTLYYLPGVSASDISWIGTVQSGLVIAMGLVSGPLFDLGYWRVLVIVSGFLTVFGMMMASISTTFWQLFLSQGVCSGIGCGLLYIPSFGIINNEFSKNRAVALGISTAGIALGAIIYTIIFLKLIDTIGFGWTTRTISFISLLVFILSGPSLLKDKPASGRARTLFDRGAFKDTLFVIFTVAQFFLFIGYIIPLFYIPIFAQVAIGISQTDSLYILVGAQGASLFGRIAAGFAAKTWGTMLPWTVSALMSGVLCFAWIAIDRQSSLVAFAVLYGFFSGALIALPPSVFPKICTDPKKIGSRMGISWTFVAIATLIGSPIAGALINVQSADFVGAQIWSGSTLIAGVLLQCVLWATLGRRYKTYLV